MIVFYAFFLIWAVLYVRRVLHRLRVGSLASRHVVITGCDSGFGHDLAIHLDRLGCLVVATALTDRGADLLKERLSSRALVLRLNVTDAASVCAAAAAVESYTDGKLWALVNNAGVAHAQGPNDWSGVEDYRSHLEVNALGMISCTKAFLPMIKKARGRVVNMASVLGRIAPPFTGPYAVSKFAARAFTDCIRNELRPFGVSVHVIEPGHHLTPLTDPDMMSAQCRARWEANANKVEYPEDYIEKFTAFLASTLRAFSATSTDAVIEAYTSALLSRYPKSRYLVGWDAYLIFAPLSMLPDWVIDSVADLGRAIARF